MQSSTISVNMLGRDIITSSYAITASYSLNGGGGGNSVSSSWASSSISSSYALTASYALNGGGGGGSEDINWMIEAPTNKTYTLIFSASYARTINSMKLNTVSGTGTASLAINGVFITGISGSGFSSTPVKYDASSNNTVNVDNTLTLVIDDIIAPVDLAFSIDTTKL